MRELRFRAKHPETGTWMYFGIQNVPSWNQKEKVQQYTGLEDKGGTYIFEGDILDVESERYPFVENRTGVVKTVDGSWVIEDLEGTDGEYLFNETLEVKIIGNIYEHKHLLEGESNEVN